MAVRRACENCRLRRTRCSFMSPTASTCVQCARSHLSCIGGGPGPPRKPRVSAQAQNVPRQQGNDFSERSFSTSVPHMQSSTVDPMGIPLGPVGGEWAPHDVTSNNSLVEYSERGSSESRVPFPNHQHNTFSLQESDTGSNSARAQAKESEQQIVRDNKGPEKDTETNSSVHEKDMEEADDQFRNTTEEMSVDARSSLDLCRTPLEQAISSGIYTREEATDLFTMFLHAPRLLPLDMPPSLDELDKAEPDLALAVVTAMAHVTTYGSDLGRKRYDLLLTQLHNYFLGAVNTSSWKALAVLCAWILPPGETGMARLLSFHALALVAARNERYIPGGREQVEQICAMLLLPFAFAENFEPIRSMTLSPLMLSDALGDTMPLLSAVRAYQNGLNDIKHSQNPTQSYRESLEQLSRCEALMWQWAILDPCLGLGRLNLGRSLVLRLIDSTPDKGFIEQIIIDSALSGFKIVRSFSQVSDETLPPVVFECIPDVLVALHCLKFIAMALDIDLAIRTDEFLETVEREWALHAARNFVSKTAQSLLDRARDIVTVSIEEVHKSSPTVRVHCHQEVQEMPRIELLKLIQEAAASMHDGHSEMERIIRALVGNRGVYM